MPRSDTESEISHSSSSSLYTDSTFASDLDETSHSGILTTRVEGSDLECAGADGGVRGIIRSRKSGSSGRSEFPEPSYTVEMPAGIKVSPRGAGLG